MKTDLSRLLLETVAWLGIVKHWSPKGENKKPQKWEVNPEEKIHGQQKVLQFNQLPILEISIHSEC